jgi:hypothetical protein
MQLKQVLHVFNTPDPDHTVLSKSVLFRSTGLPKALLSLASF